METKQQTLDYCAGLKKIEDQHNRLKNIIQEIEEMPSERVRGQEATIIERLDVLKQTLEIKIKQYLEPIAVTPEHNEVELGPYDAIGDSVSSYHYGESESPEESGYNPNVHKGDIAYLATLIGEEPTNELMRAVMKSISIKDREQLLIKAKQDVDLYYGVEGLDPWDKQIFINRYYWMLCYEGYRVGENDDEPWELIRYIRKTLDGLKHCIEAYGRTSGTTYDPELHRLGLYTSGQFTEKAKYWSEQARRESNKLDEAFAQLDPEHELVWPLMKQYKELQKRIP